MDGAGEAEKLPLNTVEIGHDVNQSDIQGQTTGLTLYMG